MPGTKEIRVKIKSVQNTRKITKAMEMVAASKMRKAQDRMRQGYVRDRFGRLLIADTRFINTMKQEPVIEQLLPLSGERMGAPETVWDYIYEPEARAVLDQVMTRYIEALIYQAVAENMASEQSARMVAMKAASDN